MELRQRVIDQATLPSQGGGVTVTDTSKGLVVSTGSASVNLESGQLTLAGSFAPTSIADAGTLVFGETGNVTAAGAITGAGTVDAETGGVLTLSGPNTFAGGLTLLSGTVALASPSAAGDGPIAFSLGSTPTLLIDTGDIPTQAIDGFVRSPPGTTLNQTIDVRGIGLATSAVVGQNDTLLIQGGTASATLQLDSTAANIYSAINSDESEVVVLASDGAGGTDVTLSSASPSI